MPSVHDKTHPRLWRGLGVTLVVGTTLGGVTTVPADAALPRPPNAVHRVGVAAGRFMGTWIPKGAARPAHPRPVSVVPAMPRKGYRAAKRAAGRIQGDKLATLAPWGSARIPPSVQHRASSATSQASTRRSRMVASFHRMSPEQLAQPNTSRPRTHTTTSTPRAPPPL
jgi:hypothetical protein